MSDKNVIQETMIKPVDFTGVKEIVYKVLLTDLQTKENYLIKVLNPKKTTAYCVATWQSIITDIALKYQNKKLAVLSCEKLYYDEGQEYMLKMWYDPNYLNIDISKCSNFVHPQLSVADTIVKHDTTFFNFLTLGRSLDVEDTIDDFKFVR